MALAAKDALGRNKLHALADKGYDSGVERWRPYPSDGVKTVAKSSRKNALTGPICTPMAACMNPSRQKDLLRTHHLATCS
jgi:hypothetical protein